MVTHRVDDVAPVFPHGPVMKAGAVVAGGATASVLSDSVLQQAFDVPIRLHRFNDRYWPMV